MLYFHLFVKRCIEIYNNVSSNKQKRTDLINLKFLVVVFKDFLCVVLIWSLFLMANRVRLLNRKIQNKVAIFFLFKNVFALLVPGHEIYLPQDYDLFQWKWISPFLMNRRNKTSIRINHLTGDKYYVYLYNVIIK